MRATRLFLPLMLAACQSPVPTTFTTGGGDVPAEAGKTYRWTFDEDVAGGVPAGFIDVLGDWTVSADPAAPSPGNVFRQRGDYGDPDFPRVVTADLTFSDLTLRVRCRPERGDTDRACGLMFRLVDSDNYYLTRANALEGNVRLYRVIDGSRQQIASAGARVTSGAWHTLEVSARGATLSVSWDGTKVLEKQDATFTRGHIGLWTKADSVTAFDDLEATAE